MIDKALEGTYYETSAPDTLDLADRMGISINALTNVFYPDEKNVMAFFVDFSRRPASAFAFRITDGYLNITPKFMEALVLCRLATGSKERIEIDRDVFKTQLSLVGEDGLTYAPEDTLEKLKPNELRGRRGASEIWGEGRSLIAISMMAQVDPNSEWVEIGKKKVDRLLQLSREKDGIRCFATGQFPKGFVLPDDYYKPTADTFAYMYSNKKDFNYTLATAYSVGAVGHGSALFYRVTGYKPALELAKGLANWALDVLFEYEDGHYDFYHFHHGLYALMAVCEYAIAANDRDMLERVDACFRWAREMGDPLIGFYPEGMPGSEVYKNRASEGNVAETCEIADMVWLAVKLTQVGMGDYWDDADRWTRNMFAEAQMCDLKPFDEIPQEYYRNEPRTEYYQDVNNIRERMIGSFFGWMRANEGLEVQETADGRKLRNESIMHCCTANGSRTFYCVWESILDHQGDKTTVNLLLNRASEWLDVDSFLPVDGKVVLHIKDSPRISVRMPHWCDMKAVNVKLNGGDVKSVIEGSYVNLSLLKKGDQVTITFPVPTMTVNKVIAERIYKLEIKGSNVVDISPRGEAFPLFINHPEGKLVQKKRFISKNQNIIW